MTERDACRRVRQTLQRLDQGATVADSVLEDAAAHLGGCPDCGGLETFETDLRTALHEAPADLPSAADLERDALAIMELVRAEPARLAEQRAARSRAAFGERRSRRARGGFVRWTGAAAALAASLALLLVEWREEAPVIDRRPVLALDDVDASELAASDDAWLVASYDIFDLQASDVEDVLRVEDLSDDELDALEGMFGSAPNVS